MNSSEEKERAIAYYEAGTAVVARNLERRVAWTTIDGAEGSPGHTELDDWWEDAEAPADIDWYQAKLTMIALAGRESVRFFLGADGTEADPSGGDLQRQVRSLIAQDGSWQAEIKAVADALVNERWLDSVRLDEVRAAARDRGAAPDPFAPALETDRTARRGSPTGRKRAGLRDRFRR